MLKAILTNASNITFFAFASTTVVLVASKKASEATLYSQHQNNCPSKARLDSLNNESLLPDKTMQLQCFFPN